MYHLLMVSKQLSIDCAVSAEKYSDGSFDVRTEWNEVHMNS